MARGHCCRRLHEVGCTQSKTGFFLSASLPSARLGSTGASVHRWEPCWASCQQRSSANSSSDSHGLERLASCTRREATGPMTWRRRTRSCPGGSRPATRCGTSAVLRTWSESWSFASWDLGQCRTLSRRLTCSHSWLSFYCLLYLLTCFYIGGTEFNTKTSGCGVAVIRFIIVFELPLR